MKSVVFIHILTLLVDQLHFRECHFQAPFVHVLRRVCAFAADGASITSGAGYTSDIVPNCGRKVHAREIIQRPRCFNGIRSQILVVESHDPPGIPGPILLREVIIPLHGAALLSGKALVVFGCIREQVWKKINMMTNRKVKCTFEC